MKKIIYLILIVHFILTIDNCLCQWQPDVRLTNDPAVSYTSPTNAWCIAASGDVVHVVWQDQRDGNFEIYYKLSTDGGISWGADTRLTNNSATSDRSSISVSGQVVHIVWDDTRDGNLEVYYKRSTDGGVSWGADTRLTNAPGGSASSSISVSGQVVHVVWDETRDGNPEIYYKRSSDGGISWDPDTRLTNAPGSSHIPAISVSGQVVHVVWEENRDGNTEVYYKRSTDGGISWGTDTRLTINTASSLFPCVTAFGSDVHVVWNDNRDGNLEIYYKGSTDGGISWGNDTRLTSNFAASERPSVTVSGFVVHVAWRDNRDGNWEIYYKRSTDGGISWDADTRLTNNTAQSHNPSVTVSGQVVHVVWNDLRDGNWEIYYKRDTTGNVVGIKQINTAAPESFSLSQNYPNPFNPTTKIKFEITNSKSETNQKTEFRIYDILGKEVAVLVNEQLQPGAYEVEWNASNFPSGIYYYTLSAGEFSQTKKAVLIK